MATIKGAGKGKSKAQVQEEVVQGDKQEQKAVTAPLAECKHPVATAFNQEREDGSGKWDRVCGVSGCGFVMCEVSKPAPCDHPPFLHAWKPVSAEEEGLFCECGHDCGDRRPVPGNIQETPHESPETEAAAQVVGVCRSCREEKSIIEDALCLACWAGREFLCSQTGLSEAELTQGVPGGDAPPTSPFTSDGTGSEPCAMVATQGAPCEKDGQVCSGHVADCLSPNNPDLVRVAAHQPDDAAGQVVATGEGAEHREEFVPEEKSTSYVSRDPHRISNRFQELLPCPVDDEELGKLGTEMAEQFGLWRKTKLDLKKFTKACKEVTDRCEARMVELEEIIQDQAVREPVDVQWEYDFTAGEKVLRRCDTWKEVRRETLTVEERQLSMDLDGSSARAVEKLREIQQGLAGGEGSSVVEEEAAPVDQKALQALLTVLGLEVSMETLSQQTPGDIQAAQIWADAVNQQAGSFQDDGVPTMPLFLKGLQIVEPAGELVGNGYPIGPDQVGEELQAVQQEVNPEAGLDQETINLRDEFCEGWRNCADVALCMGPENTTGQCYHIVQEQEGDRYAGDPLGAALAEED